MNNISISSAIAGVWVCKGSAQLFNQDRAAVTTIDFLLTEQQLCIGHLLTYYASSNLVQYNTRTVRWQRHDYLRRDANEPIVDAAHSSQTMRRRKSNSLTYIRYDSCDSRHSDRVAAAAAEWMPIHKERTRINDAVSTIINRNEKEKGRRDVRKEKRFSLVVGRITCWFVTTIRESRRPRNNNEFQSTLLLSWSSISPVFYRPAV